MLVLDPDPWFTHGKLTVLFEQVLGSGHSEGPHKASHQECTAGLDPGRGGSRALGDGAVTTLRLNTGVSSAEFFRRARQIEATTSNTRGA